MAAQRHREDLTGEHRLGDAGQLILMVLFFAVWSLDSFVLHYTTLRRAIAPLWVRAIVGVVLMGTAGLFWTEGAPLLAVAVVVVYGAAILTTLLLALMLVEPEGRAEYDRTSSEPLISAAAGGVVIGVLAMTIGGALGQTPEAAALHDRLIVGAMLFGLGLVGFISRRC